MKVKIETRQVYHKYAQVEIEIPNDWKDSDGLELQEYLIARDDLYTDKIDQAISQAKYESGSGLYDYDGVGSEWRYDCDELNEGGHL